MYRDKSELEEIEIDLRFAAKSLSYNDMETVDFFLNQAHRRLSEYLKIHPQQPIDEL